MKFNKNQLKLSDNHIDNLHHLGLKGNIWLINRWEIDMKINSTTIREKLTNYQYDNAIPNTTQLLTEN